MVDKPTQRLGEKDKQKKTLEEVCITVKVQDARLRWFGRVMRRDDEWFTKKWRQS